MRRTVVAIGAAALAILATPVQAHDRDVMWPGGKVGPMKTGESTVGQMKDLFGEPRERDVLRVGCSKVVRLKWNGIHTLHYRETNEIVDVRVRKRRVESTEGAFRFHTGRGLRVGDTEEELQELYPKKEGMTHAQHTHYILGEQETRLLAKVVDGRVVELEAAPYEFC